jgi:hypothetical protein
MLDSTLMNITEDKELAEISAFESGGVIVDAYPDFTQLENFVKLEELMLAELAKQRLTVVKWVHYFSDNTLMHEYILITKCGHKFKFKHNDIAVDNWFVERENRTECLILFILRKVLPICGDSLKQAIRDQEWIYE